MKAVGAILERFRSQNKDEDVFYRLLKVHIRGCPWRCNAGGKIIGKGILRTVVSQAEFCVFVPPFLCEVCHPMSAVVTRNCFLGNTTKKGLSARVKSVKLVVCHDDDGNKNPTNLHI